MGHSGQHELSSDLGAEELTAVEDELRNNMELEQLLECLLSEGREKEVPEPSRETCECSVGGCEDGHSRRT